MNEICRIFLLKMKFAFEDVLKTGSQLHAQLLIEEVNKVRHKHRTTYYCEQLSQFIEDQQKSS